MSVPKASPLDTLEATFGLLDAGPRPLAIDGRTVGLPVGPIPLARLRAIVFHPATGVAIQRAVLVELIWRARRWRGSWIVGLAGVLLPGLRQLIGATPESHSAGIAHLESWVLAKLHEQLDAPDVSGEDLAECLLCTVLRPPPSRNGRVGPRPVPLPGAPRCAGT